MGTLAALLFVVAADLVTPHRAAAAPPAQPLCSDADRRAVATALTEHARARGTPRGAAFVAAWLERSRFGCITDGEHFMILASSCPGGTLSGRARRTDGGGGFTVEHLHASANPQCMNYEESFHF